jgi:hypothetical protein
MPRRNKFKKKEKKEKKEKMEKSIIDNTNYSIEVHDEIIFFDKPIQEKKKKLKFFEKSKNTQVDSLIKNLEHLTNDIKKKSEEQQMKINDDIKSLENNAIDNAIEKSMVIHDLIFDKIKENALEIKDVILFRKKINVKENLKEDLIHIQETIIEKLKEYIGDFSDEMAKHIFENIDEIKELIFGVEKNKNKAKCPKAKTFDHLIKNLQNFSSKFSKKKSEKSEVVIMKEIVDEKIQKIPIFNQNLKVIEFDEELIYNFPIADNRNQSNLHILFTNIDDSEKIYLDLFICNQFDSIKNKFFFRDNKNIGLILEKKWINTIKIKMTQKFLYITNSISVIKLPLNSRKIDIINTNIHNGLWI